MAEPATAETAGREGSRGALWVGGAALVLWLAVTAPLALGVRTLYYRDVFELHLPLKAFGARELADGRVPALDPGRGLGQPFRGNPQAAAFYPGNLLYLVLPFWSAFNLHYALHWLLAALTLHALARELRMGPSAALLAALAYAGGGWTLTALSFHHVVVVTAWWPLVLWGAARGGRRGIAIGGVACGLALLGGAWVVAALGLVPLALVAAGRHGLRRGAAVAVAVAALGALVALPQIVATARILPFTLRGAIGVPAAQVALYSLRPARLAELALPLPFGWPGDLGRFGYFLPAATPRVPLVLSIHFGVVALALALAAVRRRPGWVALAAGGVAVAWAGGVWPEALAAASGGLFRYPEKFLFWTALAAPLLAGWGLDAVLSDAELRRRFRRGAVAGALAAVALGAAAMALYPAIAGWIGARLRPGAPAGTAELQAVLVAAALLGAALLLVAAAWAAGRSGGAALAALELVALLQLAPLVTTTQAAFFRRPPEWLALLPPEAAVVSAPQASPFGERAPYRPTDRSVAARLRLSAADLEAAPGRLHGLTYPLAADPDGLASPLASTLLYALPALEREERIGWLRTVGVDAAVLAGEPWGERLTPLARTERAGVEVGLYRVEGAAPEAWWPLRLEVARSPAAALQAVGRRPRPADLAVIAAPPGIEHRPGGRVRLLAATPDRLVVEVDSAGGVAVVRRAYQRLWRLRLLDGPGRAGGTVDEQTGDDHRRTEPATPAPALLPVDLHLLGLALPPGRHRVELSVPAWPEATAGAVALAALVAALGAAAPRRWLRRRGRPA